MKGDVPPAAAACPALPRTESSPETAELLPKAGGADAHRGPGGSRVRGRRAVAAVAAAVLAAGALSLLPARPRAGGEARPLERASLRRAVRAFSLGGDSLVNDSLASEAVAIEGKPRGDDREYQHSRLSNGLEVVNVRDPRARESAVAVAVKSGSSNA